jgi:hypothetical protein
MRDLQMKFYETVTTIAAQGEVRLAGLPFAPGTEVEVTVTPKRGAADEFANQWKRVCDEIRARAGQISDDEIQKEIDAYRKGA